MKQILFQVYAKYAIIALRGAKCERVNYAEKKTGEKVHEVFLSSAAREEGYLSSLIELLKAEGKVVAALAKVWR